jgi:ubiquinone/menaquinone biosynthesis C-methylase UbiE
MGYTESHKNKGRDYHETFAPQVDPHRAMIWRLEQRALDRIQTKYLPRGGTHLDFACGTGRILGHYAGRFASATGVDVSPSMMSVAREVAPSAELIEADLTRNDVLGQRQFDLITAFRFFPNAEPELRQAVISVLARHLAPQGVFVFNNHKNRNGLRYRISRLLGREDPSGTMTHAEVEALLAPAGLRVLEIFPVAIFPFTEYHLPIPISLLEPLERAASALPIPTGVAQDLIYVCGKATRQ